MNDLGLSPDAKASLLNRLGKRMTAQRPGSAGGAASRSAGGIGRPGLGHANVIDEIAVMRRVSQSLGLESPFFRVNSGQSTPWAEVDGRRVLSFCAYNYLGLNGDPRVTVAAKAAADQYGTSVSGSRIVSGERPVHAALERELKEVYGADDALAFVGGHATNVTVIPHLIGAADAVVYDALAHNSIIQGAQLSGARRRSFLHNDLSDLDRILRELTASTKRRLVIVEGCYGMDGDAPDLGGLLGVARRHGAHVMVDEAHSLGVLGARGLGVAEHCGVDPAEVDVWMGTLSKTLASCGGYIAGNSELIDYLRCSAPGFLFSVGIPAPAAAAALEALRIMRSEPERVQRLHANGRLFTEAARAAGLNVGATFGSAVIPVIIGNSLRTAMAADRLWRSGIATQAILYPGVPEGSARLRFFVTSEHDRADLLWAVETIVEVLASTTLEPTQMDQVAAELKR